MGTGWRSLRRAGLIVFLVPLLAGPVQAQVMPLAVKESRCECVLPTAGADDKYILILGCLARATGPYHVTLRTEATADPVRLPIASAPADIGWVRHIQELNDRQTKARQSLPRSDEYAPADAPPPRRSFYLFVKEHDFQDPGGYVAVAAELAAVGRHCQAYVDRDQPDRVALQPTVEDAVTTFDEEVYPLARRSLGRVLDVDRDGRFTILFSGWLGKLSNGKVSVGGFVRGSDFYRDLPAPYGNRCDMMYLNTDLKPGPHLRTLIAHEYTHAVIFSEHVFGTYLPELTPHDEESWLNEALAHLAENLHGYSWSNLDYRVSAFLSAPERYPLVVPDYYGAGLWRNPGNRGATYLFLRWCADRFGTDLPKRLIQSSLTGVDNLEAATGEHFADLFRQWSAALVLDGAWPDGTPARPGIDSAPARDEGHEGMARAPTPFDPRRPLGGRFLCGPRFQELALANGNHAAELAGTSVAYVLLHSPAAERSRVTITAEAGADLQVSLIRLPNATARLSLGWEPIGSGGAGRVLLTAHDEDVILDGAAWERLTPAVNRPEDTSFQPDRPAGEAVQAWFGDPNLKAGETRTSAAISLPREGPWILKVAGTDRAGHRIAGWLTLDGR